MSASGDPCTAAQLLSYTQLPRRNSRELPQVMPLPKMTLWATVSGPVYFPDPHGPSLARVSHHSPSPSNLVYGFPLISSGLGCSPAATDIITLNPHCNLITGAVILIPIFQVYTLSHRGAKCSPSHSEEAGEDLNLSHLALVSSDHYINPSEYRIKSKHLG